jgi:hypothetical protein
MTSNEDYELWAAMMEEDNPPAPPPAPVVAVDEPVIEAPAPIAEPQKFFPLIPVQVEALPEPVAEPLPEQTFVPVSEIVAIEPEPVSLAEEIGWSDTAQQAIEEVQREAEFTPAVEIEEDGENVEFPTNLFKEPQTNSITMPEIPDALTSEIVTETGEVLMTGAIDIPNMTTTGSIPIITVVPDDIDEEAIQAAMGDETTAGIPPIRAGSVMNSSAKVGVLPIKNRRSEGQTIILAITSILLVTMGAGVLALYMLNIIK